MDWEERIGRRLTLRDLSILLTAVETGSMSKAADQLRMSQPAISKTITQLEQEIGAQLVVRSSRGIEPTEHGRALLTRSRAALDELKHAVEAMDVLADPKLDKLRIAANEVGLSGVVGTVINRLHARYPGIVVEVVPAYTHATQIHELEQGHVELVVGHLAWSHDEPGLEADELFQEQLVIGVGARNPWVRRKKIELAELMDRPWVFPPLNTISGRSIEQAFRAHGLELPQIMVVASSMQFSRRLIMDNEFLAVFPNSVVRSTPGIYALPVSINAQWPLGILTVKHRTLSPLAKLFIEYAHSAVRDVGGSGGTRY
ncbi:MULTISPECIES: LysR family transcriptional regulator [unclassified Beijerinckia]|uniref:LysR family transcriptional regulator n=1 Tax=unclassified Beijerinckia TaxID=2638183 RepID=UPI00089B0BD9|nr:MULTISPECIES: LysR family transcriptional regulator [unclassified Beijerinckia]MDH7794273.1 DNA-binding transcriptional LysR family regulator [Beijerinckia sp. GAS462]SEB57487.1 DNA-binding transcriptional regulator, LysR family [Beijerinckia sp. 28-YEA-48]